jgi:hypothetical protein
MIGDCKKQITQQLQPSDISVGAKQVLSSTWKKLTLVCCTKAHNLEAYAYVYFSLSYTELSADQFSARVVCQSTGYSSMWSAQRTFPLTVAYRHWQDLKMESDFCLITHVYLKGYLIATWMAQSKLAVCPTQSLRQKGHRGLLTSGCAAATAPQLSISQKALGTLPEDSNVMPKHVGVTIHN